MLTAPELADREELSLATLRGWSRALPRDARAEHGSSAIEPIEISVGMPAARGASLEIAVGGAVLRCEVGADVAYVASLRALRE